ncbi:MAG TPA: hypothetical protein VEZ15_02430, partial [Acidimicrobiia bacterium]|nr:hypothetical protein [Acidimicrobiia bacterium]
MRPGCIVSKSAARAGRRARTARHVANSAATIALVAKEQADADGRVRLEYDLGQATAFMMLAATDL